METDLEEQVRAFHEWRQQVNERIDMLIERIQSIEEKDQATVDQWGAVRNEVRGLIRLTVEHAGKIDRIEERSG